MLDSLLAKARVAVPADSLRFLIGGRHCGWVASDVPALLVEAADLYTLGDDTLHVLPHLAASTPWPAQAVSTALARLAALLSAAERLNGWRGELLDVADSAEHVVGVIERSAVRPLGIATHAVHLNAWTPDGDVWLARRSLTKTTDPGLWDTLVGGLISAAETPEIALGRESWEEAGLSPEHLRGGRRVGTFRVERVLPEGYQVEIVSVVDVVLAADVVPTNQDGEVMTIRRASPAEVMDMMERGLFTLEAALALLLSLQAHGVDTGVDGAALAALAHA